MKRVCLLIAILCSTIVFAQEKLPPKVVKVNGTAEVKVTPDRAVINIGIEKQNGSASAAKRAADAAAREVLTALRANGIDEKDIQTTYLSLEPQYDYHNGKIAYFVAEQNLTVTVRNLPKLDEVLESLIKAGGNRISSVRYETSEPRKYRDQARELAVKAAREKAEAMANALGQSVGKAYSIEEVTQPSNPYGWAATSNVTFNASFDADKARSGPSTAAGQRTVTASINVWFELL